MDAQRFEEYLRDLCERSSTPFDEAAFAERLRTRTRDARIHGSAPRRRARVRAVTYAAVAVACMAAVAMGGLEAAKHLGRTVPTIVITDDTVVSATTAETISPTTQAPTQTTSGVSSVGTGTERVWQALPLTSEGAQVWSLGLDPSDPSVLYAGTEEGLYKSINGSASWNLIFSLEPGYYSVHVDPSAPATLYLYWATQSHEPDHPEPIKLMRSDDSGLTWTDLSGTSVVAAARDDFAHSGGWGLAPTIFDTTTSPATMYLGVSTTEVTPEATTARTNYWRSTDKGQNWTKLDEKAQEALRSSIGPETPLQQKVLGKNLRDVNGHVIGWVGGSAVAADPGNPSIVYAGTDSGACKSTDGGKTWTKTSSGMTHHPSGRLLVDPSSPTTLYVAAREGVFKSLDAGATWNLMLPAGYMDSGNRMCSLVIAPSAPSTVYAWTCDGLSRSDDGGATWSHSSGKGLVTGQLEDLNGVLSLVAPDNPRTLFAVNNADTWRSTDGGETWAKVLSGDFVGRGSFEADPNDPCTMYAVAWKGGDSGEADRYTVIRSTDRGATWTTIVPPKTSPLGIAFDSGDPTSLYLIEDATTSSLSRSPDGGGSWQKLACTGLSGTIKQVVFVPGSPETIFALTSLSDGPRTVLSVYRSTDGGTNWASAGSVPAGTHALVVDPSPDGALYACGNSGDSYDYFDLGVYKWVPAY